MELRNSRVQSPDVDRSQPNQKPEGEGVVAPAADVADGGNAGQVVKRKRGRPPRVHQPVSKKSKEEDEDEDVCFICFDGGSLVLCDRRGCPKAYHPSCIKRDEAFFRSKAKWNCGWHICSMCEKTAHHMCYTCTYSLCKGCVRTSDYVCVRGDKGFCTVCMKTIMLIENSGDATVDFDDKTSWEYLFKVYWLYTKGKLSLTLDELTQAKNPWKLASIEPTSSHISASGRRSITSELSMANLEANESKRRKTNEQTNGLPKDPSMDVPKEWASKELLEFVAHMKNDDTSVLSQFEVQALLLEYIKRNNLRDPRKNTQIICDLRLMTLFGKPRVGHIEMLKLLEPHFLVKDDPQKDTPNSVVKQANAECKTENTAVVGNKERRNHRKGGKRITQNKLDEYAAIDVHNMSLIYLRRNLMVSLIGDNEKFHEKVVGSIVQIRISGSDQKDDMYRLVQVVGTTKVDVPYKIGDKVVDILLEVSNLDKKETVSIDTISNQELSEDECRRLRESIRCGLVRCFTVGEIQEKAMALQSVLIDDKIGAEMLRLNQLRDRASEKGQKKGVRECVQKLKILKTPEERERRLREIPEVHSDPKMNPDYESDDTEEYFNNEQGEHRKPKFPWVSGTNTISPTKIADKLKDQPIDLGVANVDEDSSKSNMGKEATGLSGSGRPTNEAHCNGSTVPKCNPEDALTSTASNTASDSTPLNNRSVDDDMWHYRDPSGNVQGPFSMVQLQKWSTSGYFPADMRIWADREADSLLLYNVLQERFHNTDGRRPENVASNSKDDNQAVSVTVCREIPSSTICATSYALDNSVNLEKIPSSTFHATSYALDNSVNPEKIPSSTFHATSYALDNSVNPEKIPSSTVRATSYALDNSVNLEKIPSSTVRATSYALDNSVNVEKIPSSTVRATSYALDNSVNVEKIPSSTIRATSDALDNSVNLEKIPSSTVRATSYALDNSVNLEKIPSSTVRATSYALDTSVNLEKIPSSTVLATSYALDNSVNLEKIPSSTVRATSYALDNSVKVDKIPSSTVRATSYALDNSVNLEKIPSSTVRAPYNSVNLEKIPADLNCDPPSVASLTKMKESTERFSIQNMPDINQHVSSVFTVADASLVDLPSPLQKKKSHDNRKIQDSGGKQQSKLLVQDSRIQKMPDINQHVSSVFTVADAALVDLPSPLPKNESHENQKIQDFVDKEQSKPLVQDSGNPPSWSTTLSLVVGGTQLPETGDEWGRYPPAVDHQVATTNSAIDQITNMTSWHGLGETIEFSTLAEESVSDLLAEVDAMESRNCDPSPTSRRNSFLEDLFNGSIDDFSPTADQGTRSDGFSSTADIHLSRQTTGLQFSFGLETKPTCSVSIPPTSDSDNIGFKWADMGNAELHPPRQDMIDLNDSTRAEADEGERENVIEEKSTTCPVVMTESRVGRKSKEKEGENIKPETSGSKIVHGFPAVAEEEGEIIQPEAALPPPPPPPSQLPPLLPLPTLPPPAMGLDTVDSRRVGSGRPSQGTTSTGRVHAHTSGSRSGNVGRDSHHRRSGGDRDRYYSNSNSPRERSHHVEDSGYSRSSKASWGRQSSFGGGSSGGGGGGASGYSRPLSKGQRVCKFYESGRCRKGSACNYLHPQDR